MEHWLRYAVIILGITGVSLGVIGFAMPSLRGLEGLRQLKDRLTEFVRPPARHRDPQSEAILREFRASTFDRVNLAPRRAAPSPAPAPESEEDEEDLDLDELLLEPAPPWPTVAAVATDDEDDEDDLDLDLVLDLGDTSVEPPQTHPEPAIAPTPVIAVAAPPPVEPAPVAKPDLSLDDPDGFMSLFAETAAVSSVPKAVLEAVADISIEELLAEARSTRDLIASRQATAQRRSA